MLGNVFYVHEREIIVPSKGGFVMHFTFLLIHIKIRAPHVLTLEFRIQTSV